MPDSPPRPAALAPGCGPERPTRHGAPGNQAGTDLLTRNWQHRRTRWGAVLIGIPGVPGHTKINMRL
jgi:hypothetical protein